MGFLRAVGDMVGADWVGGKLGEVMTPKDTGSPEFRKRQAVREYNILLDRTGQGEPQESACLECIAAGKAQRRQARHDLIREAQNTAALEGDPARKQQVLEAADRLAKDMDRVEDAKLALHTYTANEDEANQAEFLKPLRDQAPPGFKRPSLEQVAEDFGVDTEKLRKMVSNPDNPSQKIMIYERDMAVLGPGPKYTVAFRGSTTDPRDWNNNGRNEMGFEAPHQKNAARLGEFLGAGAKDNKKSINELISAAGHSKGGSEAQAFAAASGAGARVFNPAGFDPSKYEESKGVKPEDMRIDRTTVLNRDNEGKVLKEGTDPLYYSQHEGAPRFLMKKPITNGPPRELRPIDPNLSVPSKEQSDTEPHSMLQVVEALERDKKADEAALVTYSSSAAQGSAL